MSTNRISGGPTTKLSICFEKNTMSIDRRRILFAAAAVATASQYAEGHTRENPVSQQELDEVIRLHDMWLTDINTGQRCMFGGRDLSGLQFGVLSGGPVDLNGADFTQADLSGTEADDILVHHCSFNGAKLDGCCWRQPVFAFADMRRVSAKREAMGRAAEIVAPSSSLRTDGGFPWPKS